MLDLPTRNAILRLREKGHGVRTIARALRVSRNAVRRVLASGESEVPEFGRASSMDDHVDRIRELHDACEGNLVRVHEELERVGIHVGYSSLTRFCAQHGIGKRPKVPVGRYEFAPGEEMQHDTSPHDVTIGGRKQRVQCASLVLCFSRMIYAQIYSRWARLECRTFLSEGAEVFGGACGRCMIDNSSVVIGRGTGAHAVPADSMLALAGRFGFVFEAHDVGHADRSARVERPFHYIEHNFYPGRTFADFDDLNEQLKRWCDKVNRKPKRTLGCAPLELYATDRGQLRPLPLHIPEIYDVHERRVDTERYVNFRNGRYSVPAQLIGRQVQIRETTATLTIYDGHRLVTTHKRRSPGQRVRVLLPEHHRSAGERAKEKPSHQEKVLRDVSPDLQRLVAALRKHHGGRALRAMRRLHQMWLEYPSDAVNDAVATALAHGLIDLGRLEGMILSRVRGEFFRLSASDSDAQPPPENDNGDSKKEEGERGSG